MKRTFFERLKLKIIRCLARLLPDCKTITPSLGELLDSKLSRRKKIIAKLHLYTCEACAVYAEQIEFIREVFHEQEKYFKSINTSIALSFKARERIKTALRSSINLAF